MVKMTGKTRADLDAEAAADAQQRELDGARAQLQADFAAITRITVYHIDVIRQLVPSDRRQEYIDGLRAILTDEQEQRIRAALEKLR